MSDASAKCDLPWISESKPNLSCSTDLRDYVVYETSLQLIHRMTLSKVVPSVSHCPTGIELTVFGSGFSMESDFRYSCSFGGHTEYGKLISSSAISCACPLRDIQGVFELRTRILDLFSDNFLNFTKQTSPVIFKVFPNFTSVFTRSMLQIRGNNLDLLQGRCSFSCSEIQNSKLQTITSTAMACSTPVFSVGCIGSIAITDQLEYVYFKSEFKALNFFETLQIWPVRAFEDTSFEVTIKGHQQMPTGCYCFLGKGRVILVDEGSDNLRCAVPSLKSGNYSLSIGIDGNLISKSFLIEVLPRPSVISMFPSKIPSHHNVLIKLVVQGITIVTNMACQIGGLQGEVSHDPFGCTSPRLEAGFHELTLKSSDNVIMHQSSNIIHVVETECKFSPTVAKLQKLINITVFGFFVNFTSMCHSRNFDFSELICSLPTPTVGYNDLRISHSCMARICLFDDIEILKIEPRFLLSGPLLQLVKLNSRSFYCLEKITLRVSGNEYVCIVSQETAVCNVSNLDAGAWTLEVSVGNITIWSSPYTIYQPPQLFSHIGFLHFEDNPQEIRLIGESIFPNLNLKATLQWNSGRRDQQEVEILTSTLVVCHVSPRRSIIETEGLNGGSIMNCSKFSFEVFYPLLSKSTFILYAATLEICPSPSLHEIVPNHGYIGSGAKITMLGTHFYSSSLTCKFGSIANVAAHLQTSTMVLCAISKIIKLDNLAVDLCLTSDTNSLCQKFAIYEPPVLTSIYPSSGPIYGGIIVTLAVSVYPLPLKYHYSVKFGNKTTDYFNTSSRTLFARVPQTLSLNIQIEICTIFQHEVC
eukprot:766050-Hanusia_phi.AAC.2